MNWPPPIRVVGVGSPCGDDVLGWKVVEQLSESGGREESAVFHMVDGGQRLLDLLDGRGSLLLIDALAPAGNCGTIRRLHWPADAVEVMRPGTTHHLGLAEALRLAGVLGVLPQQVVIWGVEGARFEPGAAMSPEVAAAVPELVESIAGQLKQGKG